MANVTRQAEWAVGQPGAGGMALVLENAWKFLITNFTEFQLASAGTFIVHESVFFLSGLPYLLMETWGLTKYKIQVVDVLNDRKHPVPLRWKTVVHIFFIIVKRKVNSTAAQEKCLMRLLLYHTCVNLPLMIFSYPLFKYMGFTSSLPLPSWRVVSLQIFSYFILEDFIFYWGHRILHTKWLYKHIHSVHHEADFHDYHHRLLYTKSGNYSSTFTYMDWIFGTDKGYRKLKALKSCEAAAAEQAGREKKVT